MDYPWMINKKTEVPKNRKGKVTIHINCICAFVGCIVFGALFNSCVLLLNSCNLSYHLNVEKSSPALITTRSLH